MARMWLCSICLVFSAITLRALVRHIAMQHASQPNFKVTCGINGCPDEYKKIDSYRKHLRRKHPDEMAVEEIQNPDISNTSSNESTDGENEDPFVQVNVLSFACT